MWTNAPRGVEVELKDPVTQASWRSANNPAALVYVLAKAVDEGASGPERGWVLDEELLRGVWGRAGMDRDLNGLHALVHRIRKGIRAAGLDSDCVQKKRGVTRLAVRTVEIK